MLVTRRRRRRRHRPVGWPWPARVGLGLSNDFDKVQRPGPSPKAWMKRNTLIKPTTWISEETSTKSTAASVVSAAKLEIAYLIHGAEIETI